MLLGKKYCKINLSAGFFIGIGYKFQSASVVTSLNAD